MRRLDLSQLNERTTAANASTHQREHEIREQARLASEAAQVRYEQWERVAAWSDDIAARATLSGAIAPNVDIVSLTFTPQNRFTLLTRNYQPRAELHGELEVAGWKILVSKEADRATDNDHVFGYAHHGVILTREGRLAAYRVGGEETGHTILNLNAVSAVCLDGLEGRSVKYLEPHHDPLPTLVENLSIINQQSDVMHGLDAIEEALVQFNARLN